MIGQLNQRASVLARAIAPDGGGGFSESWNAIATLWVRVEPLSGSDVFGPDAVESRVRDKIIIRRNADVIAGQRIAIGARTFRIHAVLDEGPGVALTTLLCEELP